MEKTHIGHYGIIPDSFPAEGKVNMVVKPIDMVTYWKRCGALADFIAKFYANNSIANDPNENLISTIFNELIENAAKYSTKRDTTIKIDLSLYNTILKMQVENFSTETNFRLLREQAELLFNSTDLDEMYVEKMENKLLGGEDSGIGLLMLIKDYPIKMGFQFENTEENPFKIITQVYFYMEEN